MSSAANKNLQDFNNDDAVSQSREGDGGTEREEKGKTREDFDSESSALR